MCIIQLRSLEPIQIINPWVLERTSPINKVRRPKSCCRFRIRFIDHGDVKVKYFYNETIARTFIDYFLLNNRNANLLSVTPV